MDVQPALLVHGISQRRAKHTFRHGVFLVFRFGPGKKLLRHWFGQLQAGSIPFLERELLLRVAVLQVKQLMPPAGRGTRTWWRGFCRTGVT